MDTIRTRFAPSPTGYLHVGGARTALFNYLLARQTGGTFVLRIEDTDRARHDENAVEKIADDLKWLGIEWDEGIAVGGPHGPYRQSERLGIYEEYIQRLLDAGQAYYAFETAEELEAMRDAQGGDKGGFSYPRPEPLPTEADADAARAEGRPVVVRFLNPGNDVTIHDEVFGDVTVPAEQQDDFIIRKADDYPTYHLANVVDDALMEINFIMRGQEFLAQTWRHAVLRAAFGYPEPKYAHLPLIMDMQGRKLSKRDGDVEVHAFRQAGYLPETLVNFLALLGWNPGTDQETFSLDELVSTFSPDRINKSNAKFDRDKLVAFNTDRLATADPARKLAGLQDYLAHSDSPLPADDADLLAMLLASNAGIRTYADLDTKCGVLFAADDSYEFDAKARKKVLDKNDGEGFAVLTDIKAALAEVEWTAEALEAWLRDYCETRELGMGKVAQPIRVAVTGTTVSPPIFDTLIILGRERTLARVDRCLAQRDA
jgi:glutamyl-tRNA synthetase